MRVKTYWKIVFLYLLFAGVLYATQRVSVDNVNILIGNNHSSNPVVSRDGRFVAFVSKASNLAPNDTNNDEDIFIHDRQNNTIERVVVTGIDNLHISYNTEISMSDDGRYIVFVSLTNLTADDDNDNKYDVYLIDRENQSLKCISIDRVGGFAGNGHSQEASINADGTRIVFYSTSTNLLNNTTTTASGNIFLYTLEDDRVVWNVTDTDNSTGNGGNGGCRYPHISADGRYIVFQSHASDLVAGDNNGKRDFFTRGTHQGDPIIRIDARYTTTSNIPSDSSISDDGRYIVFDSELDDLVPDDTNGVTDVFIYDKNDASITRLNVDGVQGILSKSRSQISGDGNYITYISGATTAERRVYRYKRVDSSVEVMSLNSAGENLNNESRKGVMSFDGELVVFSTRASNVTPFDTNVKLDIVIRDRSNNSTDILSGHTPMSNNSSGDQTALSRDGRYVVFDSSASNLVSNDTNGKKDIFVRDTKNNTIEMVSISTAGTQGNYDAKDPSMSADGNHIVFESFANNLTTGDSNGKYDIFLHNRQANTTTLISKKQDGTQSNDHSFDARISADGKFVVFKSSEALDNTHDLNTKSDVYMYNMQSGEIKLISLASDGSSGNGDSFSPAVSNNGRYVAFASSATNFSSTTVTANRVNIFLRDTQAEITTKVNDASEADANCVAPSISEDGKFIAFQSTATNLVNTADTNGVNDVFLYSRIDRTLKRITNAPDGSLTNNHSYLSYGSSISKDGRFVTFRSGASNLVANDTNGKYDAFIYDNKSEEIIRVSLSDSDEQGNDICYAPAISSDGNIISYLSKSTNLVAGDNNNKSDVFTSENTFYEGSSFQSVLIMYLLN